MLDGCGPRSLWGCEIDVGLGLCGVWMDVGLGLCLGCGMDFAYVSVGVWDGFPPRTV